MHESPLSVGVHPRSEAGGLDDLRWPHTKVMVHSPFNRANHRRSVSLASNEENSQLFPS